MQKIFFSYTLHDGSINKEFLFELQEWIHKQKFDCYIDILQNEYNEAGFQQKLIEELAKCDVFCQIDSDKYMSSKWATSELNQAKKLGKRIITIKADDLKRKVFKGKKFTNDFQKIKFTNQLKSICMQSKALLRQTT